MSVLQQASRLLNLFLNLRLLRWHSNALNYYYENLDLGSELRQSQTEVSLRRPRFMTVITMAAFGVRFESATDIEDRKEQTRLARAEVLRQVPPLFRAFFLPFKTSACTENFLHARSALPEILESRDSSSLASTVVSLQCSVF